MNWYSESDLPLAKQTVVVELELEHGVKVTRKVMEGQRVPPQLIDGYLEAIGEKPADEQADYQAMTVEDLEKLAADRELDIEGSGKDGNVLKADLINALTAADAGE